MLSIQTLPLLTRLLLIRLLFTLHHVHRPQSVSLTETIFLGRFDCVYPTRTARFGAALVNDPETPGGVMRIKEKQYSNDHRPIDLQCSCSTCQRYSRAFLHTAFREGSALSSQLLTIHNVAFMMRLMRTMRQVRSCDILSLLLYIVFRTVCIQPTHVCYIVRCLYTDVAYVFYIPSLSRSHIMLRTCCCCLLHLNSNFHP